MIPLGSWEFGTGAWAPNPGLNMSADEQHAHNVRAGHSCECGIQKSMCAVHGHSANKRKGRAR